MSPSSGLARSLALGALGAGLALVAAPAPAAACGGFFCQRTPMNQAGENILFASEADGSMTAYVQIFYSGEADQFAWILPLPSVPDLDVGVDALFEQLGSATSPQFTTEWVTHGTCRAYPSCWDDYYADYDRSPSAGVSDAAAVAADAGAGVTVVLREAVGPYDAVVLSGGTAQELQAWLADNGYQIPPASIPLMEDYVAAGHVFVAIRLLADRSTTEIQPLVLHYTEGEPCVPLRLTAIATVPDMPITAYFLARARAVPNNYSLVEPALDDEGLWLYTRSYSEVLSEAVDEVGGRAFATEFSGAPPAVYLELPSVLDLATETSPRAFMQALVSRGFAGDPQILALLGRHMPPPGAEDATSYYNCLTQTWCSGPEGTLDAPALVAAIEETIVTPRRTAQALLGRFPTLTRLSTTMDAAEMTVDPTFRFDEGLDPVSNVHTATMHVDCGPAYFEWSAPRRLALPSGREVVVDPGVPYGGSDAAYCSDARAGLFGPGVPREIAIGTSAARRRSPGGGGGLCSARPGAAESVTGGVALALAALALATRRARRP